MSMVTWKIEVAETGDTINVQFYTQNITVDSFKEKLSIYAFIPKEDQLLLIGPPYVPLESFMDPKYGNDFNKDVSNMRIFLFNKLAFDRAATEVKLGPYDIMPLGSYSDTHSNLDSSQSPVMGLLRRNEVVLLRNLKRGEIMVANTCGECRKSCFLSLEKQSTRKAGLQAALNHLTAYFKSTKAKFGKYHEQVIAKHSKHSDLLETFETDITQLKYIPLIKSLTTKFTATAGLSPRNGQNSSSAVLVTAAASNSNSNSQVGSITNNNLSTPEHISRYSNTGDSFTADFDTLPDTDLNSQYNGGVGNQFLNLLDCIPEEKVRAWAANFEDSEDVIDKKLNELQSNYSSISDSIDKLERSFNESMTVYESQISEIIARIDIIIRTSQNELLERLRNDYLRVYEQAELIQFDEAKIGNFMGEVVNIVQKQDTDGILKKMEESTRQVLGLKDEVAKIQTKLVKFFYDNMKTICTITSFDINASLRELMSCLKNWGKNVKSDYYDKLEKIRRFPDGYNNALKEIQRRNKFNNYFNSTLAAMESEILRIRSNEIQIRQEFSKNWGPSIPTTFYQVMPSLHASLCAPPTVEITLKANDRQWLPEISPEETVAISEIIRKSGTSVAIGSLPSTAAHSIGGNSDAFGSNAVQEFIAPSCVASSDSVESLQLRIRELENEIERLRSSGNSSSSSSSSICSKSAPDAGLSADKTSSDTKPLESAVTSTAASVNEVDGKAAHEKPAVDEVNGSISSNSKGGSRTSNSSGNNDNNSNSNSNNNSSSSSSSLIASLSGVFECAERPVVKELEGVLDPRLCQLAEGEDASKYIERIYRGLLRKIDDCKSEIHDKSEISAMIAAQQEQAAASHSILKINNFKASDLLLFVITGKGRHWMAFNVDCPNYFLNPDCLNVVKEQRGAGKPDPAWILGKIVLVESNSAEKDKQPFNLRDGTVFHIVTIEYVKSG